MINKIQDTINSKKMIQTFLELNTKKSQEISLMSRILNILKNKIDMIIKINNLSRNNKIINNMIMDQININKKWNQNKNL